MTLANGLTLLRIALTPVFVVLVMGEDLLSVYAGCLIFVVASLTDLYDGYVARRFGAVSTWGKFLDPLADKILITAALICLAIQGYVAVWMVVVIAVRDAVITGLRSYAMWKRQPVVTMGLARMKTAAQALAVYVVMGYMLAERTFGGKPWASRPLESIHRWGLVDKLMFFVTCLTVITGVLYLIDNRSHVRQVAAALVRALIPRGARV
ncbi:MAG: CDP-diacylglycerol--glycerol-3-phosphate 3-phosphatidyltransferase [candidate division KSB1 bacterium]|nr:CDP-diacylglycerol--glycerol-3-phosphate 3-phosphatidyltransferase [candidate division KSB1 bacterium]MDZ7294591.1 CDP-diacylglycerol--glycerol-3-phosphate 3-phosphatidyltransferase [candidate division KSB1 bacterium]MDZ7378349.1 CDP-diacylglycerol--glycerol-3-phosphate 3-phosphatidyltransferase [candidate division KSB1 bacterium]MDZ7385989.1 CDP-diacylglycerol--glycerol-3-phosphate 3-phosphatidyltransferase [candidate division KSB1 bacterium]MDZ7391748.1 CDP-diacylglycerol--glycerol-3-phosp